MRAASPDVDAKVRSTSCWRASAAVAPTGIVSAAGMPPPLRRCRGMMSDGPIVVPRDMITARSTAFFSSRTLPGQW